MIKRTVAIVLLLFPLYSLAQDLLLLRVEQSFPEAMSSLQAELKKVGFKVSRVQRVDVGLQAMGYKTDKYRVVFFGHWPQMQQLIKKNPLMIAYFPLSIAIFAQKEATILVSADPLIYLEDVEDKVSENILKQWSQKTKRVFAAIARESE